MSENEIRVLYVQPGKYPEERTIPNTLRALQELVEMCIRDRCMPDEIRRMRDDECLLLMRSEDPVIDRKYNLLKHPNVKYTPDAGGEPYVMPPDYMGDAATITTVSYTHLDVYKRQKQN